MPATPISEMFSGGLVTVRHPALLRPGELQQADDCVYRDHDPAIRRAPGRTKLLSAAVGTKIKGLAYCAFSGGYTDQFLLYGAATAAVWPTALDGTAGSQLYACDFSAITALAPTEVGGSGQYYATLTGTSLNAQTVITSCVANGTTTVTKAAGGFTPLARGSVISGTGVTAGTTVISVDTNTSMTVSAAITSGTITLTFTQYPFLSTAQGARLNFISGSNVVTGILITGISNQDGSSGHYRTATISLAPTGGDGTYTFSASCGLVRPFSNNGDEILDLLQFGSVRYYLWNGKNGMSALEWYARNDGSASPLSPALNTRPVGMNPVITAPTLTVQTAQPTGWNTVKGAGTYWFLITEIYSPSGDVAAALKDPLKASTVIEGAYLGVTTSSTTVSDGSQGGIGLPVPATINTVASDNILVTFPAVVNNGFDGRLATHWGIYVAGPYTNQPALSQMQRCKTIAITQYTAGQTTTLTEKTLTQGPFYPSTVATAASGRPRFSHDDLMLGDAASHAGYGYTKTNNSNKHIANLAEEAFQTYHDTAGNPFSVTGSYLAQTVYGIQVLVGGQANPSGDTDNYAAYQFRVRSGSLVSDYQFGTFGNDQFHVNQHGGPMDTFGVAWTLASTSAIYLEIGIVPGGKHELDIKTLGIKIYYSSQSMDFNGPFYRVVTYSDQVGISIDDPANLPPPICSTGDFFQGSLVVNDTANPNTLRQSLPSNIEAWPKPYRLTFNPRKPAIITYIRTLGQILIVGMRDGIKRVNYFPTEINTALTGGLVHEDLTVDHGIPGPFCAARFDMPAYGTMLAYASTTGIFITDGQTIRPLNLDLDWPNTVKVSALGTAVMRVDPLSKWINFYYCPAGATHSSNTRVLRFCYQADKLKVGLTIPAIGPQVVSTYSATEAVLNGVNYVFTGHESDGNVYVEDTLDSNGLPTNPSGYQAYLTASASTLGDGKAAAGVDVSIVPKFKTRKIYPAGFDRDGFSDKLHILFSASGINTYTAVANSTINSTTLSAASAVFTLVKAGMRALGTGLDAGTIVLSVAGDFKSVVLSRAANATGTGTTFTFDTGTLGITIRGSSISEASFGLKTAYISTLVGDLASTYNANAKRGFEILIEKVPLTFDSNGNALTWADLNTDMRLHQFTFMVEDGGPDTNRATA